MRVIRVGKALGGSKVNLWWIIGLIAAMLAAGYGWYKANPPAPEPDPVPIVGQVLDLPDASVIPSSRGNRQAFNFGP